MEHFQGYGIHHLSGQPMPVFHHPQYKKLHPYIWSKSSSFSLKLLTLLLQALLKCLSPPFLEAPFKYWKPVMRSPWSLLQVAWLQLPHSLVFLTLVFLLSLLWPRVTLLGHCAKIYALKRKCLQLPSWSNVLSVHVLDTVTDMAELCSFICVCPGTSSDSLVSTAVLTQNLVLPSARHQPGPRGPSGWHWHTSCGLLRVPAARTCCLRTGEQVPDTPVSQGVPAVSHCTWRELTAPTASAAAACSV